MQCSGRAHRVMWRDIRTVVQDLAADKYKRGRVAAMFGLRLSEVAGILSPKSRDARLVFARMCTMTDPTEAEIAAIQAASEPAGEYLESLGKTDLAQLSESEWFTLLEVVVTAYTDKMNEF